MLSEKPWKPDAVLLLVACLLISLFLGMSFGLLLMHFLPGKNPGEQKFYGFLINAVSFQGVSLLLVTQFLRQHEMGWREFLGLKTPRIAGRLALGVAVGLGVVPLAQVINQTSALLMKLLNMEAVPQEVVQLLQESFSVGERVGYAVGAIVLAPLAEEIIFRGILYPFIKQHFHPMAALIGTSVVFGAIHLNLMTFVPLTFLGIIFALLYEKTDTLLAPILAHSTFNAVNFVMLLNQSAVEEWLKRMNLL